MEAVGLLRIWEVFGELKFFFWTGKTRVYVGVRVKTTVKDLLLQHRAREANRKKQKTVNRELKELCASTFPSRHSEAPPTDITNCSSPAPTLAAFSVPDSSWNLQMQVNMFRDVQHHHHQQQQQQQQQHHHHQQEHHHHQQQQHHHHQQQQQLFGDAALLNNDYSSTTRVTSDYNSPLPPLPSSSPLPWCHVASTDADYYDHGMAPHSSSESLCNPPDPSSYSPHDSFSSSSSSCFDSPTRMDCSYGGLLSDHYPYQNHHPHQQSWANQQEAPRPTEYASFFSPTDYRHTCPVDGSFFRKDSPLSSEACYNIL